MAKKEPLKVGQTVWLERIDYLLSEDRDRKLHKMIVLKANKSSAYIGYDESESDLKFQTTKRVNQRTHEVESSVLIGYRERLWLSKEDYETHQENIKKKNDARAFLSNYINSPDRTHKELLAVKKFVETLHIE